jgi:hypothetical protein
VSKKILGRGTRSNQIPAFAIDNHAGGEMNWTESFKLKNCTLEDNYEQEARAIREKKDKEGEVA